MEPSEGKKQSCVSKVEITFLFLFGHSKLCFQSSGHKDISTASHSTTNVLLVFETKSFPG